MKQNKKVQPKKQQAKPKLSLAERWNIFISNRIVQFLLIIIIGVVFFKNYNQMYDHKIDLNGDNINYFSLAQAMNDGKGYTNTMGFEETPHTHFPPGYPAFVAKILKIYPGNIQAIKGANGLLLLLSIIITFFLLKRISGNVILAFISCLLAAAHPELLKWASQMMSEMLYLFLSTLALFIAVEITDRKFMLNKKWFEYVLIGLLVLLANYIYFVRTMGLSVIISIVMWFGILGIQAFFKWRKAVGDERKNNLKSMIKWGIIAATIFVTVFSSKMIWEKRNKDLGSSSSAYVENFFQKKFGEKMETTADWKERIEYNISNYITKWIPNTLFYTKYEIKDPITNLEWIRGISILILLIAGLILTKKWRWILFFYMASTMAVLILYPEQFGGSRYYIALVPLFIFILLNGATQLIDFSLKKSKLPQPLFLEAVAIILFAGIVIFPKYSLMRKQVEIEASILDWKDTQNNAFTGYLEAAEWCRENIPTDSKLLCRKPEIYYMYSGHRRSERFPMYASPDSVMKVIREKKATHIIIDSWYRHAYATIIPAIKANEGKFKLLKKIGEADSINHLLPTMIVQFNDAWGYKGEIKNGLAEGKGEWTYQDWKKYVGEFKNNRPNGFGQYYDSTGTMLASGIWKDGQLIKPQARKN